MVSKRTRTAGERTGMPYRALILGALLIPVNLYWLAIAEIVYYPVFATLFTLFYNVIFTLFFLVIINALLKWFAPAWALRTAELLIVYVMLSTATAIQGHDLGVTLIQHLPSLWYATPENEYAVLFGKRIPSWVHVTNEAAQKGFYTGDSSIYDVSVLRAWAAPTLVWAGFFVILLFVMICLNVIIRRQWTQNEKLAYPVIQLPIEMATQGARLLVNRRLLIGFGLVAIFDIVNGLHGLFPAVPSFRPGIDIGPALQTKPWSAMGWTPLAVYPFIVGMAYFLPVDLSLSAWVFHLAWKADLVARNAMSIWVTPGPFRSYQAAGAWIVLAMMPIWTARGYLRNVVREIVYGKSEETAEEEAISYRAAAAGILLGVAALSLILVYTRMSLWVAVLFLAIFFLYTMAIVRIRAQIGPPSHDAEFMGPDRMLLAAFGPSRLGANNVAMFSRLAWMGRSYRPHPAGHQLEAFKLAQVVGSRSRYFLVALIVASVVGVISSFWAVLHHTYRIGQDNMFISIGSEGFRYMSQYLQNPRNHDVTMLYDVGIGAAVTAFLAVLHHRFIWFPFHPVGYAVACGWVMSAAWFSVFLAWLVKAWILRFGGLRLYRSMVPFFFGAILSQFIIGGLWAIIGEIKGEHFYVFFPYLTNWGR